MGKQSINEINISGFVTRFLTDLQNDTQSRFIKKAKDKGVPPKVIYRMVNLEKGVDELKKILKDL